MGVRIHWGISEREKRNRLECGDDGLHSLKAQHIVRASGQSDLDPASGTNDPAGNAKPMEAELFELVMMVFRRQSEQLEPLGEIVGELGDHEPGAVGVKILAGEASSADTVFELLDEVLRPASSEVVFEDARSDSFSVGDDGRIEIFTDHALAAFVVGGSLDDHTEGFGPTHGPIGKLGPLGLRLPWVGFPGIFRSGFNGFAKGRSEHGRDRELQGFFQEIGGYLAAIEAGIESKSDATNGGNTGEALGDEAGGFMGAGSVPRAESHSHQDPGLRPEAKERMKSFDLGVAVPGSFFEVSVDLKDGAIEIEGDGLVAADDGRAF